METDNGKGLILAVASSVFIGSSFILKKKGLKRAGAIGTRAGYGGYTYLLEPLWWAGMVTMIVGEAANFVAYIYAPAVLVTPLGALSIIISAVLAHFLLKEKLKKMGVLGCVSCIVGSVVIVIHAPKEQTPNSVEEIWNLATQPAFLIYVAITMSIVLALILHFEPLCGQTNILVYIGICSLMGALTVMSIKAIGIAIKLTMEGVSQIGYPQTWLFVMVAVTCVVTQLIYLNKALDTFNAAIVSPVYYVMFTTLTIVASAIMFKDWSGQDAASVASELCGFITVLTGTMILHGTREEEQQQASSEHVRWYLKNEFDTRACNHSDPWNGVWCDDSTGAVTMLQLRACLSGTLKPNSSLFQFHHLRSLLLPHNNFTSSSISSKFGMLNNLEVLSLSSSGFLAQVPFSFSNLSMLSALDLSKNELTGSLSFVRNLRKLRVLDVSYNHFSGILNPNSSLFELHHLIYLNLRYNNFTSSSLPYEFGNLNKLEVLDVSSNSFFGQVPPTISNLTQLTELYLPLNDFTGSLPLVQNLTKLSILHLFGNHFSGTIPSSLFTMPFLSSIYLNKNNLSGSIEVPNSSSSSRLEHLYLGKNHLGKILEPIAKLVNLKELDLSFLNTSHPIDLSLFSSLKSLLLLDLSGDWISKASLTLDSYIPSTLEVLRLEHCDISEFPNVFKTLHNLEYIALSNNRISGKFPEWLWSLPRLSSVFITDNLLTGFEGSSEVLVNSSVQILSLDTNSLEGALPHLPLSINYFSAIDNRFGGDIPLSICNRSSLDVLDLSYNNFSGQIPPCLSNLLYLKLRKNNLEGSIPDKYYVDTPLRSFDVGYNRLTGKLPRSLINCSALQFLSVDHNGIKDTFPFYLKALPKLQVLLLSSNEFYGPLSPPNQGPLGFPELRILEIAGNKLTGSLPPDFFVNWKASSHTMNEDLGLYMVYSKVIFGNYHLTYYETIDLRYKGLSMEQENVLTSSATIDLSGNRLEGEIPESLGLLKALIALNLSNNAFTGHIPLSLANLKKIESLDLSSNQLSGTIPNGLGTLSFLAYMNVSHNQLNGEIPQGTQITGQPKSSFEGNAGLCGFPLQESCFGTNAPPAQKPKEEEEAEEDEQELNWKAVAIGYGVGVLLGLAIAQLIASYKPEWLVCLVKSRNPLRSFFGFEY